jgi:uncharacterized membrane protein YhfC
MMNWVRLILFFVAFAAVALIAYNVLRVYVFSKLKVNKWIILGIAIAIFLLQNILAATYRNTILDYVLSFIFIILFLWFFDMTRYGANNPRNKKPEYKIVPYKKDKNKKDVVIKPKAKPNRIKNNKEE